jgi:tetratricopeptide (TPR) repeat protein/2-polyprenyl-3-methyl-5-hydroxy-6-metoxy-1,4-benzoquinol methylase
MELTIEQVLQRAVNDHKAGKLQDAEALYRAILQTQPKHPDANHNLGVMAVSLNKTEAALPLFKIALEANPNQGQFWLSYVDALIKEKQFDNARNVLEQGKKQGLAQERVDELESQLAASLLAQCSEISANKISTFTQQRKRASAKKNKKINLPRNLTDLNQISNPPQNELNTLLEHYQSGRYNQAEKLAKRITKKYPDDQFSWKVLGAVFKQTGRLQDSSIANRKALEISPYDAEANYNLGNTLKELGRLKDAETSYKKAIAIKPDWAEVHYNLGITLQELGRLEDAETSYKKAIAIKPDWAEVHYNLGNTLNELGRLEDAETSYKKAIGIKPNYAEAHSNLGITLQELGRIEDAFNAAIKSIRIKPTVEAKNIFIAISKKLNIETWDRSLSLLVITALLEPWGRPSDVMPFAMSLLSKDKEFAKILDQLNNNINEAQLNESLLSSISEKEFDASTLLGAMLTSTPIPYRQLETLFTTLRTHLLKVASSILLKDGESNDVASLYCWIAQQCFINEYVYFQTIDEIDRSQNLRDLVTKALEADQNVPLVWVIAVACYFPLYSITGATKLLQKNYSSDINSVLVQQIKEPLEELDLRKTILSLTNIENQVSLKVQSQYEENPYPRWTRLPKDSSKKNLNSYIQSKFPSAGFQRLDEDRNPEILVAGCGTGQHSIGTAQSIRGANILAVDLSIASLSYAKRKTAELDIESIEYAQADLLKLNLLDRNFDMIESLGVLHHLENPFDGLEVLNSLLRPHGLLKLGFYSELARRDIVIVRNLISSAGIGSSSQDIRGYRRHLFGLENNENYGFATSSADFFSISACRDLLFHAQEHRMNLLTLDRFFKDNDLTFLGFVIDSSVIQAYKERFSNDMSATNLEQWHIYEQENPDTFISMYQFYVQRKH